MTVGWKVVVVRDDLVSDWGLSGDDHPAIFLPSPLDLLESMRIDPPFDRKFILSFLPLLIGGAYEERVGEHCNAFVVFLPLVVVGPPGEGISASVRASL